MENAAGVPSRPFSFLLQIEEDQSPALQVMTNATGEPIVLNQTARRFIAGSVLKTWNDLFSEDDCLRWSELIRTSSARQIPVSGCFILRRFDKALRKFVIRSEPKYDGSGNFIGHAMSGMDVSDIVPTARNEVTATAVSDVLSRTLEARHWHDELVSIATVIAGCVDLLPDMMTENTHRDLAKVLKKLQGASDLLSSTVMRLSSVARTSTQTSTPQCQPNDESAATL